MSSSRSDTRTEYVFEPFEQIFLHRREQIVQLVGLAGYALRAMQGMTRLSEVLHHPPDAVQQARNLEAQAEAEVAADLPLLHSAASVLIWGALEAAFRDFLVRWLLIHPTARVVPELKNVKVRVGEYESLDEEDRMRCLVTILERDVGASLKPGIGRFDCLLRPFGIDPKVSDSERRSLAELAAVRNVIVHRAGVADARLVGLCPWLSLRPGDVVTVGSGTFIKYIQVTSNYAAAVIDAARAISQTSLSTMNEPGSSGTSSPGSSETPDVGTGGTNSSERASHSEPSGGSPHPAFRLDLADRR